MLVRFTSILPLVMTGILSSAAVLAQALPEKAADRDIAQLYHSLPPLPRTSLPERLNLISAIFLGKPYLLGALGEGAHARFDQFPRYRTDAFDCDTYVTTVMALALSDSLTRFKKCLRNIRYHEGKRRFILRNHFTDLDWNINNENAGRLRDITRTLTTPEGKPAFKMAEALIDKPGWYAHFTHENIRLLHGPVELKQHRLIELQRQGQTLPRQTATLPYIPLSVLFDEKGRPNLHFFNAIPDGAVIEIVRPDWDIKDRIGTRLNISHLGFVFRVKGIQMFRQASSEHQKVVDVPLTDYLKKAIKSPTIRGINIQVVLKGDC